jgi:hypothetical protein
MGKTQILVGTTIAREVLNTYGFLWYHVVTMYIRTVRSKDYEYVQLAHNYRDPKTGNTKARILYNFGRKDKLDPDELLRLVQSISRFLDPADVEGIQEDLGLEFPVQFLGSRQLGGCHFLDGLWSRLGVQSVLKKLLGERGYEIPVERLIFAMVANRALAPSSKLHMEHWVSQVAHVQDLPQVQVHALYRAMDFLLESAEEVQQKVFFTVADLFNLEVDLIFLDTTSTYFEIEEEDKDSGTEDEVTQEGLRKRGGHSKDKRPDLPQVVVAFAVTRTGIPVRCWVWPGNTVDQNVVDEVKRDLNSWSLGRVVLVEDTGFNSAKNKRILRGAGGHYIIGERMRLGSKGIPAEALQRGGRYRELDNGLKYKEVIVGGDGEARERFVVILNPAEAKRTCKKREDIVKELEQRLEDLQQLEGGPHKKAVCALRSHRVFGRYVRQTKTEQLRVDKTKVRNEARMDGKYLVSTSDDSLSTEDVALGYKQLANIERVFRDLKHVIDMRPVRHRLADRIRAHVLLCWLAMLLIRVAENETKQTWFQMKKSLDMLQVGIHRTRSGEVWQTTPAGDDLKTLFSALKIDLPKLFISLPSIEKHLD